MLTKLNGVFSIRIYRWLYISHDKKYRIIEIKEDGTIIDFLGTYKEFLERNNDN